LEGWAQHPHNLDQQEQHKQEDKIMPGYGMKKKPMKKIGKRKKK
jgi:hypothetical protein